MVRLFDLQLMSPPQSVLEVHPHAPEAHLGPGVQLDAQSEQEVPAVPQASSPVPEAHVPELQHPPLHAVWFVPRHAAPHLCAPVSHA